MSMTKPELRALVERYFAAVDAKDLEATLANYTADCCIRAETAGVQHTGRDTEIRDMLERMFKQCETIWHGEFHHVADSAAGTIASQFLYRSVALDGTRLEDRNCNIARVEDGRFSAISVYMAQNTLT
jgi:ketosteroid isomerase-like protein